ncbi:MAG: DUF4162 domain-containing protein, partial [Chloroflexia bacterium]|nr:DUF4162 domain-containing protein [Chloroflexia bacterium]
SSHILTELAEICDHVGIIEKGRLLASGPVDLIRRQARQGRIVQVRVLERLADLQSYLQVRPDIQGLRLVGDELECSFLGEEPALAGLLRELLAAGFEVVSFAEERRDLEDIFFRITKGEVA